MWRSMANPELREIMEEHPELRERWMRGVRTGKCLRRRRRRRGGRLVADVNRLDALFFSRRPEDHAELARAVETLDRDAFAMLAKSMGELAAERDRATGLEVRIRARGRRRTQQRRTKERAVN